MKWSNRRNTFKKIAGKPEIRLFEVLDHLPSGILITAADGAPLKANRSLRDMFNIPHNSQGTWFRTDDFLQNGHKRNLLLSGELDTFHDTRAYNRSDGSRLWADITTCLLRDSRGRAKCFISIIDDITGRRLAEEAAFRSNRKIDEILQSIQDGFFVLDRNWCFIYANDCASGIFGMSTQDLIGQNLWDRFPEIKGTIYELPFRTAMEDRAVQQFVMKTGRSCQWYNITVYPSTEGISVYWQNITQSKKAEEELARHQELLQGIYDSIPVMLVTRDSRLKRFSLNRYAEQVTGWTTDEANRGGFLERICPDPDYREQVIEYMKSPGEGWREWNITARSGEVIPGNWVNMRLNDDTMIGIGIDLTEIKKVQKEYEAALRREGQILAQVHDSIIATDMDGNITQWNSGAERIFGYPREEVIGRPVGMLYFDEDIDLLRERIIAPLQRDGSNSMEVRCRRKNGELIFIHLSLSLLRQEDGLPYGMIGYSLDITENRREFEKLRASNEALARYGHVVSDRDRRIMELKQEVNELRTRLGEEAKYRLTTD